MLLIEQAIYFIKHNIKENKENNHNIMYILFIYTYIYLCMYLYLLYHQSRSYSQKGFLGFKLTCTKILINIKKFHNELNTIGMYNKILYFI